MRPLTRKADRGPADRESVAAGSTPPSIRRAVSGRERLLTLFLPGAAHLHRGERFGGLLLLSVWVISITVGILTSGRAFSFFEHAPVRIDEWIALITLLTLAAGSWGWANYDLNVRMARPAEPKGESQWSLALRSFRKNRLAVSGLSLMILLYLVTLITPLLAPYDPIAQENIIETRYLSPSADHLMGTDRFGRDVFTRVLYGARISLTIGFIAVGIGLLVGILIGATAGYFGRWIDRVLMRFTDTMLAFPRLVLLILVIALFEPSIWLVITVLGLTGWMGIARIVRGEVLSLKEREFVQAARALGMSDLRIITRHILPGTLAPIIVFATLGIGNTILLEAGLSFLGLGVQPPTPSWGNMISQGRDALINAWWIATFPGLAIVFTVMAFNFLGDGLRDALDPKLRR